MSDLVRYEVRDGVAVLTWDMAGSVNVLDEESIRAFVDGVEKALADDGVKGVIVTSGKPDFIVGADVRMLARYDEGDPEELYRQNLEFKAVLRRMEKSGKPFVAALNGTALGGGYEIALACHRRIAADQPKARFGLPEVKLGLLPGGGGTQRLPRMIGARDALPLMTEGKTLDAERALKKGLVDEVVPADRLMARATAWIHENPEAKQPWDAPKFRAPGGEVHSPKGYETFIGGNAMLRKATWGNYPAPQAIMACVYHGLQMPLERGSEYEARRFIELARGAVARNMMRSLFVNLQDANKLRRRPDGIPTRSYEKVGVLGAGMMGAGIAYQSALRGLEVVLLDTTQELAERGKAYSEKLVKERVAKKRMSEADAHRMLERIRPTTDFAQLAGCSMVVEAVFESREIKADVTAKAEAVLGEDALFASNTSTLPITGLAEASKRPERFIGLHFFSPVEKMPLVEVIVGEKTNAETLAQSLDYVKAIGKTPIVVNDSRGFFTSRVFGTYVNEGIGMLLDGVEPARIEHAGKQAGMPVGPLALADEVSLELITRIAKQTEADMGSAYVRPPSAPVVEKLVELGRIGKKAGQGFYAYPEGESKRLWSGLIELFPPAEVQPSPQELGERLLTIQAVETIRCMDEGVVTHPADADIGSILGWGFAPFHGGVLSYADTVGLPELLARCEALAARHGDRFAPPEGLRARVAEGRRFHD